MVDRFDWARRPGDDVEEAIGLFLQRDHFFAQTIKASRGDRGVDIRVPAPGGFDVYQVKGFASGAFSSSRKRQVRESLASLKDYVASGEIKVVRWFLVTPMEASLEARNWFDEVTKGAGFECAWLDMAWVENKAIDYPEVMDYYFNGGRERLLEMQETLGRLRMSVRDVERGNRVTTDDMIETLAGMRSLLEQVDPFYDWEFHSTRHRMVESQVASDAVFYTAYEQSDGWVTVVVRPRFAEALKKSPVKVSLKVSAAKGSTLEADVLSFDKFGTELRIPAGAATGEIVLPGGVRVPLDGMELLVSPSVVPGREMRISLHRPGVRVPLVQVPVRVEQVTSGPSGLGTVITGSDLKGVFGFTVKFDLEHQTTNISFNRHSVQGRVVGDVIEGLRFLGALDPDLHVGFAEPYGPVLDVIGPEPASAPKGDWDAIRGLPVLGVVEDLMVIQEHMVDQLTLPDGDRVSAFDGAYMKAMAGVLRGEVVALPDIIWNIRGEWFNSGADRDPEGFAIETRLNMRLNVGDRVVEGPDFHAGCERTVVLQKPSQEGVSVLKYRAADGFHTWASLNEEDVTPLGLRRRREVRTDL